MESLFMTFLSFMCIFSFCRMKEQRDTLEQEHQEEIDNMQQGVRELKSRIENLQLQLEEKQV